MLILLFNYDIIGCKSETKYKIGVNIMIEIDFDLFLDCVFKYLVFNTDFFVDDGNPKEITDDDINNIWEELQLIAKSNERSK